MNAEEEMSGNPQQSSPLVLHQQETLQRQIEVYARAAGTRVIRINRAKTYYGEIRRVLDFSVEKGRRVLSIRCDAGQYLEWTAASEGTGVDLADEIVEVARREQPGHDYTVAAPENYHPDKSVDYVVMVNAVNELFDTVTAFENLKAACEPSTRLVIIWCNYLWAPLFQLAERVGLKRQRPPQDWTPPQHLRHMLNLAGFEEVRFSRSLLLPIKIPILSWVLNRWVAKLPVFEKLCLVQTMVARPGSVSPKGDLPTVSVIIPCRNEKGHVEQAVVRTPEMGQWTELIFCDDQSTDGTGDEVRRVQAKYPERRIRLVEGPGINKAHNVWTGFDKAEGDVLMILDGDLAVCPEELPLFYKAIIYGRGEFINGTRLVYARRDESMRFANVFGNKMFSLVFSHILRQDITDTLCGTKVLWRRDYERLKAFRGTWGTDDRWGDYELIFGAARLGLKYLEVPVHYMERQYGVTKMTNRLYNAAIMFRMCVAAFRRLR
ncbi:MAG: glycosyltransferase [Candidatus Latescibacterota bacterium]|nr:glycosyltransferase [Candidatus Latescibacterota bacterium]